MTINYSWISQEIRQYHWLIISTNQRSPFAKGCLISLPILSVFLDQHGRIPWSPHTREFYNIFIRSILSILVNSTCTVPLLGRHRLFITKVQNSIAMASTKCSASLAWTFCSRQRNFVLSNIDNGDQTDDFFGCQPFFLLGWTNLWFRIGNLYKMDVELAPNVTGRYKIFCAGRLQAGREKRLAARKWIIFSQWQQILLICGLLSILVD